MHIPCKVVNFGPSAFSRVSIAKSVAESPTARKRAISAGAGPLDRHSAISEIKNRGLTAAGFAYHGLQPSVERIALSAGGFYSRFENFILGDPVCAEGECSASLSEIDSKIDSPVFAHISESCASKLESRGFRVISLGNESIIDLPFSLDGANKADLRRARNNAGDAGISIIEVFSNEFAEYASELKRLNHEWFAGRKLFKREFRLLARPYVDEFMPSERRFLAFRGKRIVGMACYDPSYMRGEVTGYFESIIRSYDSSIKGVRDSLTLSAISAFQRQGMQTLSLGLCPFETVSPGGFVKTEPMSQRMIQFLFRNAERIFPFHGLSFHKSRYRGRKEPVFLATRARYPVIDLYRLCKASHIDPFSAILS